MTHNFRNMKIYQRAIGLAVQIYRSTLGLPKSEELGLRSQLRRAAVSVCLNIAEGSGASSNREFRRFLEIARRSLYEIDACLLISEHLGLLKSDDCRVSAREASDLAAMITGFAAQLRA
jgi:four helix bundle protein